MIPPLHLFAAILLLLLTGVFAGAAIKARIARAVIHCACFGGLDARLGWRQVAQAPVLVAISVLLILKPQQWSIAYALATWAIVGVLTMGAWTLRGVFSAVKAGQDRKALADGISESTGIVV